MEYGYFLDFLPLWALFIVTIVVISLSVECGFRFGARRRRRTQQEKDAPVGAVVGATLALLGFMLAITFGIAVSRFDFRRQTFLAEVNVVSSAYMYADLLPTKERDEIRALLREYVDVRLIAVESGKLREGIAQSEKLHSELWSVTLRASEQSQNFLAVGIFAQTLNSVFDAHAKRIFATADSRIPVLIWVVLYLVAMVGMAELGYQAALAGSTRSPATIGLITAFAAVLFLVADLDRPQGGFLIVSQQAMKNLRRTMDMPPS
ncbi:MAG: hypothetical protein RL518_254 [Pseudomonadota bacterium]|jgi:hypothetical protein